MIYVATWMNPENFILSETFILSDTKNHMLCDFICMKCLEWVDEKLDQWLPKAREGVWGKEWGVTATLYRVSFGGKNVLNCEDGCTSPASILKMGCIL